VKQPQLADGDYIVLSDLQCPLQDKAAVKAIASFMEKRAFDGVLCVGDEADQPEPSRWNKGMAGEYTETFEKGLIDTYDTLRMLSQAAFAVPFHMMRSNHTDRINIYLSRYAPAMALTSWNSFPRIMGYDGQAPLLKGRTEPLPITWHDTMYEFAPGWVMAHGDETSANRLAGSTAMGLARKVGKSVVCGHTHKAAITHDHSGFAGKPTKELFGVEVGHLMDVKKAQYLTYGYANWTKAFGILYIRNRKVTPVIVPIQGKSFVVEGERHSW